MRNCIRSRKSAVSSPSGSSTRIVALRGPSGSLQRSFVATKSEKTQINAVFTLGVFTPVLLKLSAEVPPPTNLGVLRGGWLLIGALLAAMIHDFQHPGLNSNFLQATKHEYAITYNDQSILESMHVASAWKVLLQDECNFLKNLSKEQYLEFRDTVIQLVLATDMKFHFECARASSTETSS